MGYLEQAVWHKDWAGRHDARGAVKVNGVELKGGDGAKIAGESELEFSGAKQTELLLFDLP